MTAHVIPYSYAEAKQAIERASRNQQQAEQLLRQAATKYAEAERQYRKALALRIVELHAEGVAWTVCQDIARGDNHVADLRYERDVAEGVREAQREASFRHAADRRELEQLVDWSKRAPDGADGFEVRRVA